MARSRPTTQARNVAARSSRILAATGRCLGETSNRIPSRYRRGWRARYKAITTTLAPSTNSLPPAVTYGRIDPRRKLAASSIKLATTPDCGLASSVLRSTGYSRSEEHTSELQSQSNLVCRLLLEKKKKKTVRYQTEYKHT